MAEPDFGHETPGHDRAHGIASVAGEVADVAAPARIGAAADLLCRFGADIGGRRAGADATPADRAAWSLALEIHAAADGAPDDAPPWLARARDRARARLEAQEPDARAVLELRWGLGEAAPAAPEAIARRLGIAPGRVHRLERSASIGLADAAGDADPEDRATVALLLWFHLSRATMVFEGDVPGADAALARLPRGLRPLFALLDRPHDPVRSDPLAQWLTRTGPLTHWKYGDAAPPATRRAGTALPIRVRSLVPVPGEDNGARFAALAASDRRVHLGHAVPWGAGPRHRRAVEATHLLRNIGAPFVDVMTLFACHAAVFGPPGCSPSTYARTLSDFPHLLVEGVAHRWAALDDGPSTDARPAPAPVPERRAPSAREADEPASPTIAARIHDRLADEPALRAATLAGRLGDVSPGSVAGAVDADPSLRRYAPGLIARYADLDALSADPPAALLDEAQWRLLSDALRSGERPDDPDPLFPAWRGEALEALVRWGRDAGLRFVDTRTRLRDADLEAMHSGFEPRHLVAALIACAERSSIGWMRLNRLLGAPPSSRGAIWPVALLTSLGVIEPADHWQHPLATDRARAAELRSALCALAGTRERLGWRDEGLRALLARFDARDRVTSPAVSAWLRGRRASHFLDGRLGG